MPSTRDELLARIYERGSNLATRRRRRLAGSGAALLAIAVVMFVVVRPGFDASKPSRLTVADDGTTTSAPTTTETVPTTNTSSEPPTSIPDKTVDTEPETTTTMPVCRNSTDPACGAFYYDWTGPNHPATIEITMSPAQPRVGEQVTFTVTIDDPDGRPISRCYFFRNDDPVGQSQGVCADGFSPGYGPWDPPPPWHAVETYSTTFSEAREHRVEYETPEEGPCDTGCPRQATGALTFTVTD